MVGAGVRVLVREGGAEVEIEIEEGAKPVYKLWSKLEDGAVEDGAVEDEGVAAEDADADADAEMDPEGREPVWECTFRRGGRGCSGSDGAAVIRPI
jgi:hypothetical protein